MACDTCTDGTCMECSQADDITSSQLTVVPTGATCVCGTSVKPKTFINCTACNRWWHAACAGLDGLTRSVIVKIVSYKCPACFELSPELKEKLGVKEDDDTTRNKDEGEIGADTSDASIARELYREVLDVKELLLNRVIPSTDKIEDVNNSASTAVKNTLNENLLRQTKTWAEVIQNKQEQAQKSLERTITVEHRKIVSEAIDSSRKKAERDNIEREKRKCNCVIRDIPESTKTTNEAKRDEDLEIVTDIMNIDPEYVVGVYRAGPPKRGYNRPVIVTLTSPDLASELHNYGRGSRRVNNENSLVYWVNQDLIQVDRTANFKARDEARKRQERGQQRREHQRRGADPSSPRRQSTSDNESREDHQPQTRRQSLNSQGSREDHQPRSRRQSLSSQGSPRPNFV